MYVVFKIKSNRKHYLNFIKFKSWTIVILLFNFLILTDKQKWRVLYKILTHEGLVSTERSYILKQTSSFQLEVCLIMYELLVETKR